MFAFVDVQRHFYIRIGSFTIHRAPTIEIIICPPRMEERYVPTHEMFPLIVQAFLAAAEQYGGDQIAINLLKEHLLMAAKPIFVILVTGAVLARVGTSAKALDLVGANPGAVVVKSEEDFAKLSEEMRLAVADTDPKVATLLPEDKLGRAWEVLNKWEPVAVVKAAKAKGVKALIRDLFAVEGARHNVADIVRITGGTEVSVKTALSDLRSPVYCKPGEPLTDLHRLPDGNYGIVSEAGVVAAKAADAAAKEAAGAEAKAAKEAEKAAAKAAKDAEKAAAKAAKEAEKAATAKEAEKAATAPAVVGETVDTTAVEETAAGGETGGSIAKSKK